MNGHREGGIMWGGRGGGTQGVSKGVWCSIKGGVAQHDNAGEDESKGGGEKEGYWKKEGG